MRKNEVFIHPSATVHPKAHLDSGVWIGPCSYIGERVCIHKNTRLDSHIWIDGLTEIGADCHFSSFSSIGTEPQDVTYRGEETEVKIGDRNIFREFITVHRGSVKGGGRTVIGTDNYFMAYSHIAHDCKVGDQTTFINGATLGGHVVVGDHVTISSMSGVHQFCRIGKHAFIGGHSVITQDVLPYCRVAGMRPIHLYGLNTIGLQRKGFSREKIETLKKIFKIFFYSELNTTQALEKIQKEFPPSEEREEIINFIQSSKRGIIRRATEKWEPELD
ncbi:MAG: acyl-ACP--UDP-N-acetylglucosamine O-acyltransferase [Candidatus Aminicenantales bacterium]